MGLQTVVLSNPKEGRKLMIDLKNMANFMNILVSMEVGRLSRVTWTANNCASFVLFIS